MADMAPAPKDERFMLRISADEREMLRALAEDAGESEATVVRQLIKAAFKAREPKKKR
jgi:predicted DNA-binding protein